MKITAAIIDDEQNIVEILKHMLKEYYHNINLLFTSNSFNDAKDKINLYQPNILFLDINLDRSTGFDLLFQIKQYNYIVIFISMQKELIFNSFLFNTAFFIDKPIAITDLSKAMNIAISKYVNRNFTSKQELVQAIESINSKQIEKDLYISDSKGIKMIKFEDILYCKSDGRYTEIYYTDSNYIVASKNIGEYEAILPKDFFMRIHKSYIVNLNHVKTVLSDQKTVYCKLINNKILPVSKRKTSSLFKIIKSGSVQ